MKFCAFCGKQLKDEDTICDACGKNVEEEISDINEAAKENTASNDSENLTLAEEPKPAEKEESQYAQSASEPSSNAETSQGEYASNPYRDGGAQAPINPYAQQQNGNQFNPNIYGQPNPYAQQQSPNAPVNPLNNYRQNNQYGQQFNPQKPYGSGYFDMPDYTYTMPQGTNKYGIAGLILSLVGVLCLIILFAISLSVSADLIANHPELAENPDLLTTHPELFEDELLAASVKILAAFFLILASCITGIVFSAIGISKKRYYTNSGTATAGLIISCIILFLGLLLVI